MDENKFSYKEVLVRYDNVLICVICSKMVEKVFEYNAHDDEDVSANYVYYVKKKSFLGCWKSFLTVRFYASMKKDLKSFFQRLNYN